LNGSDFNGMRDRAYSKRQNYSASSFREALAALIRRWPAAQQ
jgi:hypothetical protein